MIDPNVVFQSTFEAARDDTFYKLTTLTHLVKGHTVIENALVDLTGSVLAVQTYKELKPYNLILQQLPVTWPNCVANPAVLELVIKQFVAFSTKRSKHKVVVPKDTERRRGHHETNRFGRISTALKDLDEALRTTETSTLPSGETPLEQDIPGLIWKPPPCNTTALPKPETENCTACISGTPLRSPAQVDDIVGFYEQCIRACGYSPTTLFRSSSINDHPARGAERTRYTAKDKPGLIQKKTSSTASKRSLPTTRKRSTSYRRSAPCTADPSLSVFWAPPPYVRRRRYSLCLHMDPGQSKLDWVSDQDDDNDAITSSLPFSAFNHHQHSPPLTISAVTPPVNGRHQRTSGFTNAYDTERTSLETTRVFSDASSRPSSPPPESSLHSLSSAGRKFRRIRQYTDSPPVSLQQSYPLFNHSDEKLSSSSSDVVVVIDDDNPPPNESLNNPSASPVSVLASPCSTPPAAHYSSTTRPIPPLPAYVSSTEAVPVFR